MIPDNCDVVAMDGLVQLCIGYAESMMLNPDAANALGVALIRAAAIADDRATTDEPAELMETETF